MSNEISSIKVIGFTKREESKIDVGQNGGRFNISTIGKNFSHEMVMEALQESTAEHVMFINLDELSISAAGSSVDDYFKAKRRGIYYLTERVPKLLFGMIDTKLFREDHHILQSPILIGRRSDFLKAYSGSDLDENLIRAVGFSLLRQDMPFYPLNTKVTWRGDKDPNKERSQIFVNYVLNVPFRFLMWGGFFKGLFNPKERVRRDMVYRFLMFFASIFLLIYMPYISKDYGISGDEYVDHQHSLLVLDYFTKGDKAALNQPKTTLHLYGNVLQVVSAAIAKVTGADDVYHVRHVVCATTGAVGIIFVGLLGARFGGALCGLLSMLMLFLSPRYFGHSMNNLKDIPFAVGYLISIFYFIRLFDRYPVIKLRHIIGAVLGIALALGTRSGGLLLFPYLVMYGGLFYILWVGVKEFYKFGKHRKDFENIALTILSVLIAGYLLSIVAWPFALDKPLSNVFVSLQQFTNYGIGLRTIFEGKQVMSNMLPMHYAPKYLIIASPLIVVVGLAGFLIYLLACRKNFSLPTFFLLFVMIFPVFWVIYKNSNLYGGIRHMLFVIPIMVVLAARFWSFLLGVKKSAVKVVSFLVVVVLLLLPTHHMVANHPNDYIYFNELVGGLKGAYGYYETDYYYNSLKKASDWFKENVDYKDREIVIVTNHSANLEHYFRNDPNVKIIYSRYYEKFSKDWDYMIFANVYINDYQLKNGLFPIEEGLLYSVKADGLAMSFVGERRSKEELEALSLEQEGNLSGAITILEDYLRKYPWNEEMWMRLARIYYGSGETEHTLRAVNEALKLQPQLADALSIKALSEKEIGNYREAHRAVDGLLTQNSRNPAGYLLRAEIFAAEYKDREAIEQLNRALNINQQYIQALMLAGDILKRNRNYKQAISSYEAVVRLKKADEKTLLSLADCYCRTGVQEQLQQIIDLLHTDGQDHYGLAKLEIRLLLRENRAEEVEKWLKELQVEGENDSEWWVLMAMCKTQLGKAPQALEATERAFSLNPRDLDVRELKQRLKQ